MVNLERTNLGALSATTIAEPIDLMTIDLSYLALAQAMPQLAAVPLRPGAQLLALVKPMYELALATPPHDEVQLRLAVERAAAGIEGCGWAVRTTARSSVTGSRGAIEYFVHAQWTG